MIAQEFKKTLEKIDVVDHLIDQRSLGGPPLSDS